MFLFNFLTYVFIQINRTNIFQVLKMNSFHFIEMKQM